jgi:hypothetical protein
MVANFDAVAHKRLEDSRMLLDIVQHREQKHSNDLFLPVFQRC